MKSKREQLEAIYLGKWNPKVTWRDLLDNIEAIYAPDLKELEAENTQLKEQIGRCKEILNRLLYRHSALTQVCMCEACKLARSFSLILSPEPKKSPLDDIFSEPIKQIEGILSLMKATLKAQESDCPTKRGEQP